MAKKSDMKRPQAVNAEFDNDFEATGNGGAVLIEQLFRSLGIRRIIEQRLAKRSEDAEYSMTEGLYALMAGLALGGHGIQAAETLRANPLDERLFGLKDGAPSEGTMYNILCELSGLQPRTEAEAYEAAGACQPALDIFGQPAKPQRLRRMVPDQPEYATAERRRQLQDFTQATAGRCLELLQSQIVKMDGFTMVFGDGSDLEVEGRCFDAAEWTYAGVRALRWLTVMAGPVIVAEELGLGARDEGRHIVSVLERARPVIDTVKGVHGKVLAHLDSAYFEKGVVERTREYGWKFLICANRLRGPLQRVAEDQLEASWHKTGRDARRGWADSQFSVFAYRPEGWDFNVTILALRWREQDDLPGIWHYTFLGTDLEPGDLPKHKVKEYGFARYGWMLYSTKQGRENHYKTALEDLGLHHPPSGRLGINQAFYAIGTALANMMMVLRYRVMQDHERGIRVWRFRDRYVRIAGRLVEGARRLTVRLSGACVDAARQALWLRAFAVAARL